MADLITVYHGTPCCRTILKERELACFMLAGQDMLSRDLASIHYQQEMYDKIEQWASSGSLARHTLDFTEYQRTYFIWFSTDRGYGWSCCRGEPKSECKHADEHAPAVLELDVPADMLRVPYTHVPDRSSPDAIPCAATPCLIAPLRMLVDGYLTRVHVKQELTGLAALVKSYPGVELIQHDLRKK